MSHQSIDEMNSEEIFAAIDSAMHEVHRQFAAGELDLSGRYSSDEALAAGAATGGVPLTRQAKKASAA